MTRKRKVEVFELHYKEEVMKLLTKRLKLSKEKYDLHEKFILKVRQNHEITTETVTMIDKQLELIKQIDENEAEIMKAIKKVN